MLCCSVTLSSLEEHEAKLAVPKMVRTANNNQTRYFSNRIISQIILLPLYYVKVPEGVEDAVFVNGGGDVVGLLFEDVDGVAHSYAYASLENH